MADAAENGTPKKVEHVISMYRKLRTARDKRKEEHSKELAPINEQMQKIENWLHKLMNESGLNSMPTDAGTAYKTTLTKASVTDGEELLKFVQQNELWHILERRVSKTAVQEYIEATGQGIPGVKVSSEEKVNVRK